MANKQMKQIAGREEMNAIIKHMSKNQNETMKMNAGQLREAARLYEQANLELFGTTAAMDPDFYAEHIMKGERKMRTKKV